MYPEIIYVIVEAVNLIEEAAFGVANDITHHLKISKFDNP